jgi:hypothetical protein
MDYDMKRFNSLPTIDRANIRDGFEFWNNGDYFKAFERWKKFEGSEDHKFIQLALSKIYVEGLAGVTDLRRGLKLHVNRFFGVDVYHTENYGDKYNEYIFDVCNIVSEQAQDSDPMKVYATICLFIHEANQRKYKESVDRLKGIMKLDIPLVFELYGFMVAWGSGEEKNVSKAIESFHKAGLLYLSSRDRTRAQLQEDHIRELDPNHPLLKDLQAYLYGEKKIIEKPANPRQGEDGFMFPDFPKDLEKHLASWRA